MDPSSASIRDLESPQKLESDKFVFTNSLDRSYDDSGKIIKSVSFDISRYGQFEETLTFHELVTEAVAIREAEKYLSKPITEKYYNNIREDLLDNLAWAEVKKLYHCRGDCLGDNKFLETVEVTTTGDLLLRCGS